MKISRLIFISFLFILLLFSITTYINYRQASAVKENAEYISVSGQTMRNTTRFQRNILNMVSGLRGYLLTGEKYFIQTYDSAAIENETILKELFVMVPDSSQKHRLNEIIALNNIWMDNYAAPLRQAKMLSIINDTNLHAFQKMYREKLVTGQEKEIQAKLTAKFKEFSNYEYASRDYRKEQLARSVQTTGQISLYLTVISVLVSLIIVTFLAHRISSRIVNMSNLANDISAGNYLVHIPDDGKDELSALSKVLNNMASKLSETISTLKRKNQELDQFAHIVSHDLKGPLRGIDNVVSWIEEDHKQELSPKMNEYLHLIKERIVRGETLIAGILSYARVGKEVKQTEEVNVNTLVNEVIENVAHKKGLRFIIQPGMPTLQTEKIPLFQVFSNLILNAVKYHDKDTGAIKVYYQDRGYKYEFFVEDDGPGISRVYHDKIFQIFQTLNDNGHFESSGVGLAIVKKILDAKNESIKIASEPGKGSVFSFTWSK
ncbi:ATP-binding protein [Polluticoccus soli]|uniref:sensor histidine kinase n=1 Tax=Polluticoccus soli TaxID=3034150 RepID=UPI0023E0B607|nr:ATP-binding protein [Flavipsychrobacter sp. JY13-12]